MGMSIPYEKVGRTRQKSRTRDVLVAATRTLVASGGTPTVEDAAERAGISRTTAYRYFPNQRALLVAAHPEIQRESLLGALPPGDPAMRLDLVLDEFFRITLESEAQLRMALRLSLEDDKGGPRSELRRGRAIAWIEDALAPLADRLPKREVHRLAIAIRATAGIESLIWLTDVAKLSRPDAVAIMRWSARALLQATLRGEGTAPRKARHA